MWHVTHIIVVTDAISAAKRIFDTSLHLYQLHLFFFFLIQQFITQRAKADCGNYFHSYIHKMHTNMKLKLKGKKEKRN